MSNLLHNSIIRYVLIVSLLLPIGCKKCSQESRCDLEPEAGSCKAYVPRYYYDKKEKKCKEFIWGGCGGVVPFKTLAECGKQCECK